MGNVFQNAVSTATERYYRDGIEVEKGIRLTEQRINDNRNLYEYYCNIFTAYPDLFLDIIQPSDERGNFTLFFYQRIFLRACMRFRYHYCTAPRAFSKTFISMLALILKCIFQPGIKVFVCSPAKSQAAKVAKEKISEIYRHWPLLRKEVISGDINDCPGNFGKDYVQLSFRNGSVLDVVGAN